MTSPEEPIVVTDKRRIDPVTGEARPDPVVLEGSVEAAPVEAAPVEDADGEELSAHLDAVAAELTADLQRITAEYANYRKRVDRDRVAVIEAATAGLLEALLPLLDNVELARQHGDLEGAFKGVGEGLESLAEKYGLERFGSKGEPFDPAVHHALVQAPEDPSATVTVVAEVLMPGWRLRAGKVLRAAGVAVSEPGSPVPASDES